MLSIKRIALSLSVSAVLVAGTVAGVGAAPTNEAMMVQPVKVVKVAKFGEILVTSQNKALYYWDKDVHGKVACVGKCATVWPPLLLAKTAMAPTKVTNAMGKFGVAMRRDGSHQLSFNNHPLYTFTSDTKPLQVLCDGVDGWHVVRIAAMMH